MSTPSATPAPSASAARSASVPKVAPKTPTVTSQALFFPAVSLYGALMLPWSVLAMLHLLPAPALLATPYGHAHEMLLGFALGVVAGYQLPPLPRARARLLFALWLAARVASVFVSGRFALAFVLDGVFAAVLALHMTPRLFRAAKKASNRVLPSVLAALCAVAVAFDAAVLASGAIDWPALATALVLLLAALMTFMGGRLVAAEAAGQLYRQGEVLAPRVQPRIEAAVLVLLAAALVFAVLPELDWALRLACVAAGALSLVRLLRWRLYACKGRPDLYSLASGYAWLGIGLTAMGLTAPGPARTAALHGVTIGALGTLTLNVMINTMLLKAKRAREGRWLPVVATAFIAAAALARAAAAFAGADAVPWLVVAATCWSAGFLAAFGLIAHCARVVSASGR